MHAYIHLLVNVCSYIINIFSTRIYNFLLDLLCTRFKQNIVML